MKKIVAIAAALLAYPANAGSPDYCRPYAAQTSELVMRYLWTRAYYSCMNTDEDPPLIEDPIKALEKLRFSKPTLPPEPPGSVPAGFDPDEVKLCKKYYRTFREKDGTVVRRGSKRRVLCPQLTQN